MNSVSKNNAEKTAVWQLRYLFFHLIFADPSGHYKTPNYSLSSGKNQLFNDRVKADDIWVAW